MLEQYIRENQETKVTIKKHQEKIDELEILLKPIEEQLAPYYRQIKELKSQIAKLNETLYQGYYMEVRMENEEFSWFEEIVELKGEHPTGKINYDISFVKISSKTSLEDAYKIAQEIVSDFNRIGQDKKRELVSVVNLNRKIVYDGKFTYKLNNYIAKNKKT